MQYSHLYYLLEQQLTGSLSAQEHTELEIAIAESDKDLLISVISDLISREGVKPTAVDNLIEENTLQNIISIDKPAKNEVSIAVATHPVRRVHSLRTAWFRYAAAIILVFGAAAYFWKTTKETEQTLISGNKRLQTDIVPGGNRAILTLANGQQIILDSTQGNIVKKGSLTVVNLAGKLKYEGIGTDAEYNTISTPRGGQYQIVLPDGSKVWLNAASSIKFPTAFTGSERNVEMTGEAYMEVAKNPKRPFIVKANGAEIQVLGTSFNVNAYEDETAIKTTLIDGSVKVMNNTAVDKFNSQSTTAVDRQAKAVILKPGQQCSIVNDRLSIINKADIEQALAWKNGMFQFNHTNLAEIMRQLARWYDVEVIYEKAVPDITLDGEIKRDLTLSQMLDALGELRVKLRMEGRKLIVM